MQGRNAVVLGLGVTGLSLARWLARHGADVRVADTRDVPPLAGALASELPQVKLETGPFSSSTLPSSFNASTMMSLPPLKRVISSFPSSAPPKSRPWL